MASKKVLTEKEINKILRRSSMDERSELCYEVIILFLLTSGLDYPNIAELKVSDVMEQDGRWKTHCVVQRKKGGDLANRVFFLTNAKLRLALDKYVSSRLSMRHLCTLNWNEYRGLQPDSPLFLTWLGKPFSRVMVNGSEKYTFLQTRIGKIFNESGVERNGSKVYKKIFQDTFEEGLICQGVSREVAEVLRSSSQTKIDRVLPPTDYELVSNAIEVLYGSVVTTSELESASTIFHYCTMDGFIGIISSNALWLSDLLKMNDPNELVSNLELSKKAYMESGLPMGEYSELVDESRAGSLRILSSSFSKKRDDLNQWRSYADDGKGISIGLDRQALSECLASHMSSIGGEEEKEVGLLAIENVNYDKPNTRKSIENKFSLLWNDYSKSTLLKNEEIKNQVRTFIWKASALNKSSFYHEEEEVRAFLKVNLTDLELNKIAFRNGVFGLTAYIALNLGDSIREIVIGPKNDSTIDDVYYFMMSNGIRVRRSSIRRSSGEYR
ncbi:DUF2971 domain-containing protein [Aliagarivorans marinus]|uniref:DUF2971 domain-containing protein n=1 Tax=Aliagarivorans marinus TaxID=561965 RepID=UPI0003FE87DC|nr:DUF2971 domain-containing protein [Aliagarivorans marinus]